MILGVKCEGCKMWTRIDKWRGVVAPSKFNEPYYCDECESNVTYHTTKATITTTDT